MDAGGYAGRWRHGLRRHGPCQASHFVFNGGFDRLELSISCDRNYCTTHPVVAMVELLYVVRPQLGYSIGKAFGRMGIGTVAEEQFGKRHRRGIPGFLVA